MAWRTRTVQGRLGKPAMATKFLCLTAAVILSAAPIGMQQLGSEALPKQWCIADPQAPYYLLQSALDWACGQGGADCTAIQRNRACFWPNTIADHASYAFNSYWQKFKNQGASCFFNAAAFVTESNPSHGSCQYNYVH